MSPIRVAVLSFALVACGGQSSRKSARAPAPEVSYAAPQPVTDAEVVRFPSRDEELTGGAPTMLEGLLFRPPGEGPFSAVVALHGCAGLYDPRGALYPRDREWAMRLRDEGHVVIYPDSFTPRGAHEQCSRGAQMRARPGAERPRDAYAALAYLQSLPYVRADHVTLMGWSQGAIGALFTVNRGSPARPKNLGADFRQAIAFYPSCAKALENVHWKTAFPLEILIGELDDWTPAAPCMQLAERARQQGSPVETVVYRNAYHDFDAPGMPLHVRTGVAGTPSGRATLGTESTARADAIQRVHDLLAKSNAKTEAP